MYLLVFFNIPSPVRETPTSFPALLNICFVNGLKTSCPSVLE